MWVQGWFSSRECRAHFLTKIILCTKILRGHFEMTVIYHIEMNTELYCSFRNDSRYIISKRLWSLSLISKWKSSIISKGLTDYFSAECLPIEFGQDSIGKHSEHAKGVQKTVSFEMSFQSDSWYIISKWLRALSLLSKRQSYIISKRASFQNYSFRRDNHLSFLKDCPQGIIHPLSKGVDLLSFLADSILTRGIMPC